MRIHRLELNAPDLQQLKSFYHSVLGLPVVDESRETLVLRIGSTDLAFRQAPVGWQGRYHFAFNIPENCIESAKDWTRARTALIRDATGVTLFHFEDWNAHGLYFFDPSGNIVELIARHALQNASDVPFDGRAILSVSEVGLAVDHVPAFLQLAQNAMAIPIYRQGSAEFATLGNEEGLLVVVSRGRPWFPGTGIPAEALPTIVVLEDEDGTIFVVDGQTCQISKAT